MGYPPSQNHTIDRYPNQKGNYEPGNVRWATAKQQARNMTSNTILCFDGKSMCISEWAEYLGINGTTIHGRLKRKLPLESVLFPGSLQPFGECGSNAKLTENQVKELRKKNSEGVSPQKLASKYKVHVKTIKRILARKTWTHI
jgi:hypothetical protein